MVRRRNFAGLAFIQKVRHGHRELGNDTHPSLRVAVVFTQLAAAILTGRVTTAHHAR
jgi:hypothetical protein